jgi:hypothetical protein
MVKPKYQKLNQYYNRRFVFHLNQKQPLTKLAFDSANFHPSSAASPGVGAFLSLVFVVFTSVVMLNLLVRNHSLNSNSLPCSTNFILFLSG